MSNREKLQLEITQKWDECCQSCCKYRRSNGDSDIRRFLTGSHCIKITTTHIQHTAKIEKAKSLERAVFFPTGILSAQERHGGKRSDGTSLERN